MEKIKSYDFTQLANEIHKNAVWWQGKRTYSDIFASFVRELSEALEEYRNCRPPIYFVRNGEIKTDLNEWGGEKPQGTAVEFADAIIRLFDASQKFNWQLEKFEYDETEISCKWWEEASKTFSGFIIYLQAMLIRAYEHRIIKTALKYYLEETVKSIFFYCNQKHWNIDEAIRMKHKYNIEK